MLDGEDAVTAAGADDDCGAVGFFRAIDRDGGLRDVGHAFDVAFILRRDFLFRIHLEALFLRCPLGPELKGGTIRCHGSSGEACGDGRGQGEGEKSVRDDAHAGRVRWEEGSFQVQVFSFQ